VTPYLRWALGIWPVQFPPCQLKLRPAPGFSCPDTPGIDAGGLRLILPSPRCESATMFGFKKRDPAAKLRRDYERLMAEAVDLQRRGDIKGFAEKTREAADLEDRIAKLEAAGPG